MRRRRAPSSAGRSGPSPSCSPVSPWPGSSSHPGWWTSWRHEFRSIPWQFSLAVSLNRWIFPYIFLVSIAALFQGVLNAHGRFAISAAAPIFMNVGFILATLVLAPRLREPSYALAAGVLLGGVLQMAVQWPQLARLRAVGRPELGWRDPDVRQVLLLTTPRLFAYGINTINLTFATRFATGLGPSNVSRLYFANRLKELVLGGFAVALATAILPLLSRQALSENREDFKSTLAFALRLIAFVTVPATAGLIVLRASILRVLFQGGAFRSNDTQATAGVLATLSAGPLLLRGRARRRARLLRAQGHADARARGARRLRRLSGRLLRARPALRPPRDRPVGVPCGRGERRDSPRRAAPARGSCAAARSSDPSADRARVGRHGRRALALGERAAIRRAAAG